MKRLTDDGVTIERDDVLPDAPEPVPAPDPDPDVGEDDDVDFAGQVAALSIDDVMGRVEAGEWDPQDVYDVEEDGKGRITLLRSLESFAAEQ